MEGEVITYENRKENVSLDELSEVLKFYWK